MFNLTSENLSTQRNNYVNKLLTQAVNTVAQELVDSTTGREVAIPALTKIVTAVMPNTGKGHADMVRMQVTDAVDQAIEAINGTPDTEASDTDTEASDTDTEASDTDTEASDKPATKAKSKAA